MDLKTPSSNEECKNKYSNLEFINQEDQIKFVICDRKDYEWTISIIKKYKLFDKCEILFSPVNDEKNLSVMKDLANWILEDQLQVRFQIQLHKLIWGDVPGV